MRDEFLSLGVIEYCPCIFKTLSQFDLLLPPLDFTRHSLPLRCFRDADRCCVFSCSSFLQPVKFCVLQKNLVSGVNGNCEAIVSIEESQPEKISIDKRPCRMNHQLEKCTA